MPYVNVLLRFVSIAEICGSVRLLVVVISLVLLGDLGY